MIAWTSALGLAVLLQGAAAAPPPKGSALLKCQVNDAGLLSDCKVMQERPAGAGIGEAALRFAPRLRMKPEGKDGAKLRKGIVTVPIVFKGDEPAPQIAPGT